MAVTNASALAGRLPDPSSLVAVDRLVSAYYQDQPDPSEAEQRVSFGTSGHRGSSLMSSFNEAHVLAISEALCCYRDSQGIDGPLFLGRDTHGLSEPAFRTIVEVLGPHGVVVMIDPAEGATPTPVVSHAILTHNRERGARRADGIVVTPSHNPPEDGGFKYNPPHGGPAGTDVTSWIEDGANRLLEAGLEGVRRIPFEQAVQGPAVHRHDYVSSYVDELPAVVDLDAIRDSGVRLGVDPLGGASIAYWQAVAERHRLDLTIVNDALDPSVAFVNDPDADRHGIVTPGAGLLNPNHHLAACIAYLFGGNRDWSSSVGVGKTLVSSGIIDRVAADLDRRLVEVPVGFKWFVDGLTDGS